MTIGKQTNNSSDHAQLEGDLNALWHEVEQLKARVAELEFLQKLPAKLEELDVEV